VTSRRTEILAEMGITPVWKVRARGSAPQAQPPARAKSWTELKQLVPACTACGLHRSRTQTVFGVGDEQADWMLIGEAPGAEEDRLGEPFVGQAGRLLDNMLAAIDLKRGENVYIANVLKCRPPGNRNPEPEEVERCSPHLRAQIELIGPKLIVAMGRFRSRAGRRASPAGRPAPRP
jgi:DNA polymerase